MGYTHTREIFSSALLLLSVIYFIIVTPFINTAIIITFVAHGGSVALVSFILLFYFFS